MMQNTDNSSSRGSIYKGHHHHGIQDIIMKTLPLPPSANESNRAPSMIVESQYRAEPSREASMLTGVRRVEQEQEQEQGFTYLTHFLLPSFLPSFFLPSSLT